MSLVAYDSSSDEDADDDEIPVKSVESNADNLVKKSRTVMNLPAPNDVIDTTNSQLDDDNDDKSSELKLSEMPRFTGTDELTLFKNLPKPKQIEISPTDEVEENVTSSFNKTNISQEKSVKRIRAPVKISLPSLSEFKDVEEEKEERKKHRIKPSEKGTGLFAILPPPKGSNTKATIRSLIPDAVKKVSKPLPVLRSEKIELMSTTISSGETKPNLASINDDTDSDEENVDTRNVKDKIQKNTVDFFSLADSEKIPLQIENSEKELSTLLEKPQQISVESGTSNTIFETLTNTLEVKGHKVHNEIQKMGYTVPSLIECRNEGAKVVEFTNKVLTSNVINLPKEEIIMKNKTEVGPKLPVPEQEYNVDSQGNVAFDDKAIEYLCGRRGMKRKNKDFDEANIIEINGEDIKPDEREWLVKTLTEQPAERPVSMEGAGPSTQSKKKHQITYLAHQAKAMEVELKNQWAQNRVTRKQTQSKYGF
ncbi:proline-rich protein PRCC [Diprion similis]|uniref:proline-rich protein PRCC n=1 Tax=Diprion similis TaxID=362088 RepID=UPI001EF977C7|nr:proline-rich protein PRCC [Diprion similis]